MTEQNRDDSSFVCFLGTSSSSSSTTTSDNDGDADVLLDAVGDVAAVDADAVEVIVASTDADDVGHRR